MPVVSTAQDHVLEAVVNGPDGANRLYTCTGVALSSLQVSGAGQVTNTIITFPIGPVLQRRQFIRAIATATPDLQVYGQVLPLQLTLQVVSVEADWDDESGRAEVRVELSLYAAAQTWLTVGQVRYWATILAEV